MNTFLKLSASVLMLGLAACSHSMAPTVPTPATTTPIPTIAGIYHETDGNCWTYGFCTGARFHLTLDSTNTARQLFMSTIWNAIDVHTGTSIKDTTYDTARIVSSAYVRDSLTVSFTYLGHSYTFGSRPVGDTLSGHILANADSAYTNIGIPVIAAKQ